MSCRSLDALVALRSRSNLFGQVRAQRAGDAWSGPGGYQGIRWLVQVVAENQAIEHLRYELFGRDSSGEQNPHPQSYFATSIQKLDGWNASR